MANEDIIINFRDEPLQVTRHAIIQFRKRWFVTHNTPLASENVLTALTKLLSKATPDTKMSPVHRVQRIISNNFEVAQYWVNSGWRFVIVENKYPVALVTVERILPHTQDKRKKRNRKFLLRR